MSREVTPGNGPPNIHAIMGYQDMTPMQMNGGGGPMNGNLFGNSSTTSNNRKNDYVDSGVGELQRTLRTSTDGQVHDDTK